MEYIFYYCGLSYVLMPIIWIVWSAVKVSEMNKIPFLESLKECIRLWEPRKAEIWIFFFSPATLIFMISYIHHDMKK